MSDLAGYTQRIVRPWSLTTAEILYWMPDHRDLLQMLIWQDYDLPPEFPRMHKFLDFWTREIEGPLHSVRIVSQGIVAPRELRYAAIEVKVH